MSPVLLLLVGLAAGAELDLAKKAYADVDYARCRERAQGALGQPGTRDERVQAYRLLGLCSAAHGDVDDAREAFRLMLVVDRDAKLPDGLSPRFTSSFREAKGALVGTAPLALTVIKVTPRGATRAVRIRVDDEAGAIAKIAARATDGATIAPTKKASEVELEVSAGVDVTIVGLDAFEGELVSVTLVGEVPEGPPPRPGEAVEKPAEPSLVPVIVAGAVIGGVIVVGGAVGLAAALLAPPQAVTLRTDVAFSD